MKFAMFWKCGEFIDSIEMETIFIPASHLGGNHTRRYWGLDRQGGCKNIWEGAIGLMTMVER